MSALIRSYPRATRGVDEDFCDLVLEGRLPTLHARSFYVVSRRTLKEFLRDDHVPGTPIINNSFDFNRLYAWFTSQLIPSTAPMPVMVFTYDNASINVFNQGNFNFLLMQL
ncbi:hypothetical protein QQZ08_001343 [Neonectria magnoliae]|uniref:Uncharacterized protein n=1 Tax=Neonectria magnoliae TaxID=2732573 RepID=A0ABR1IEK2_9HYPO